MSKVEVTIFSRRLLELKVAKEFRLRTSFGELLQIFASLYCKLDFP